MKKQRGIGFLGIFLICVIVVLVSIAGMKIVPAYIEYFAIKKVFPTGVMQPMDAKKIKLVDKIVPIFTKGKLTPESAMAQGTTPYSVGFVDGPNGKTFAAGQTECGHVLRDGPGRAAKGLSSSPRSGSYEGSGTSPTLTMN